MRNIYLVLGHEIVTTLSKRSFWVMTILFPILILGLNVGTQIVSQRAVENEQAASQSTMGQTIGYVDQGGLIAEMPDSVPAGTFQSFASEEQAKAALEAGQIARYYVLAADFVESGDIVLVDRTFRPFGNAPGSAVFEQVVYHNLVGDAQVAAHLIDPTFRVRRRALAPQQEAEKDNPLTFWVPYAVMFVFFFSLTMSSGLLLQSVAKEKETRTAEVLLLSLRPRELMVGKLVGLGAIALFQLLVWMGAGLLVLGRGEQLLGAAAGEFALPPGFALWVLLYFCFGYAAYASALGALGVLAPTAREGTQFTFIVLLPLMIPLWLNHLFIQEPHGTLATVMSLFPPTAPLSMVTRLAAGGVPLWQPLVGLVGLAGMSYLFVLIAARLFRADTLLSHASLDWQRIWREFRRALGAA
jgi:ABC-2 type transport system permease protein